MRVLPLRRPAIPVRDMLTTENINNRTPDGREVFGAVIGSSDNTGEIGELGVLGNERVLGCGDAVPRMRAPQFVMHSPGSSAGSTDQYDVVEVMSAPWRAGRNSLAH